jgi:hypothetical protein
MKSPPPTVPAPLPTDHRLLSLAGRLKVTKRDALAATVEVWAWIEAQATEGMVPQPVLLLDVIAEIEGYGEAAVAVGLVGTADGHIVAPAELRCHAGHERRADTADDEKRKAYERDKKRKQRKNFRLMGKVKMPTPTPTPPDAAATSPATPSSRSRRLGTVAPGQEVMLLWSKRNSEYFYKCTGATPHLTGTVTDQDNPTLADALTAFMDARLTQHRRNAGKLDAGDEIFSPSMEQLVEAARREQHDRQAATAAASHVDEGNSAFAQAAAEDEDYHEGDIDLAAWDRSSELGDADNGDNSGTNGGQYGDTGTCPQNVPGTAAEVRVASHCEDNGLGAVPCPPKCPQDVRGTAPSSSSSGCLSSLNEEIKESDTTTRGNADGERDAGRQAEHDDFSRYLAAVKPRCAIDAVPRSRASLDAAADARVQRYADALGSSPSGIREQWRSKPQLLLNRLYAAGIDPKTGFSLANASAEGHAPTSSQDASGCPASDETGDLGETSVQATGGIVGAEAGPPASSGERSGRQAVANTPVTGHHADDAGQQERGRPNVPAPRSRTREGERDDETARLKAAARRAIAAAG